MAADSDGGLEVEVKLMALSLFSAFSLSCIIKFAHFSLDVICDDDDLNFFSPISERERSWKCINERGKM